MASPSPRSKILATALVASCTPGASLQKLVDNMRDADVDKAQPGDITLNWGSALKDAKNDQNLFKYVNEKLLEHPIYSKLVNLSQNLFKPDVCENDTLTDNKTKAINDFLDTLNGTQVFQLAYKFLVDQNFAPSNFTEFRQNLFNLWFGVYSRCSNANGSSGFEHVFLGEKQLFNKKREIVGGQHNWVIYYLLQKSNSINYKGYFSHAGDLVGTWQYTWDGYNKSTGGFFIGTSPTFDFSIYTVCFYFIQSGAGFDCEFTMDNSYSIKVLTFTQECDVGTCLGTAYPDGSIIPATVTPTKKYGGGFSATWMMVGILIGMLIMFGLTQLYFYWVRTRENKLHDNPNARLY